MKKETHIEQNKTDFDLRSHIFCYHDLGCTFNSSQKCQALFTTFVVVFPKHLTAYLKIKINFIQMLTLMDPFCIIFYVEMQDSEVEFW